MTLYVATENAGKLREMRVIFGTSLPGVELLCVADLPAEQRTAYKADETETTYAGNALIKARALHRLVAVAGAAHWVLAEDSGFEVEALNGAPGVYSARYRGSFSPQAANGPTGTSMHAAETDATRCEKILAELTGIPPEKRRAEFVACIVLLDAGGNPNYFFGRKAGFVAPAMSGQGGFGYDPIFCPELGGPTWAELGAAEKNNDSHRSRALAQAIRFLQAAKTQGVGL